MTTTYSTICDGCGEPIEDDTSLAAPLRRPFHVSGGPGVEDADLHNRKCLTLWVVKQGGGARRVEDIEAALQKIREDDQLNVEGCVQRLRAILHVYPPSTPVVSDSSLNAKNAATVPTGEAVRAQIVTEEEIRSQVADAEASSRLSAGVFGHDPEMTDRTGGVG